MVAGNGIYPVDMLAIGVINRSLSLTYGFSTLIKSKNYIAAAHLVRPHLDNYLRFYAVWLVDNPHDFASLVLKGERIDKLKDKKGKYLRDSYLVEIATKEYPWMANVYTVTSGFIHLSKKHVFTSTKLKNSKERTAEFLVSKTDKYVPKESIIEGIECMTEISYCILNLLLGWTETKEIRG